MTQLDGYVAARLRAEQMEAVSRRAEAVSLPRAIRQRRLTRPVLALPTWLNPRALVLRVTRSRCRKCPVRSRA